MEGRNAAPPEDSRVFREWYALRSWQAQRLGAADQTSHAFGMLLPDPCEGQAQHDE